jgi:hypothetical protein
MAISRIMRALLLLLATLVTFIPLGGLLYLSVSSVRLENLLPKKDLEFRGKIFELRYSSLELDFIGRFRITANDALLFNKHEQTSINLGKLRLLLDSKDLLSGDVIPVGSPWTLTLRAPPPLSPTCPCLSPFHCSPQASSP